MKIALLGYGKMGKEIEKIALEKDHEIVLKKTESNDFHSLEHADVAIDFSTPQAAVTNISAALNHNIPIISGTTGWLEEWSKITDLCQEKKGAFLYASNFSLGVNIFFEINRKLAQLINKAGGYQVEIEETHHTQKLDSPSGTAITLANDIITHSSYKNWRLSTEQKTKNDLIITAHRVDNVPGVHQINYISAVDKISIEHEAYSRQGFALGAVVAAEWIVGKTGIFSMKDVLGLGN